MPARPSRSCPGSRLITGRAPDPPPKAIPALVPNMSLVSPKTLYFGVAGLNSVATTLFFYYFYFFAQQQFGFGNRQNLWLAALQGATYAVGSWIGGRCAQRWGYSRALRRGLIAMALALAAGTAMSGVAAHVAVMIAVTLGTCFTWPSLEALVSHGEDRAGTQWHVGLYNLVWAGTGALAYFLGGALLDAWGMVALHWVPLGIVLVEWLLAKQAQQLAVQTAHPARTVLRDPAMTPGDRADRRRFLRMAWMANPFAYMAIQTLVAVMPGIAARLGLSTTWAGVCGSLWCFARLAAFAWLWRWEGWHYRFGWLAGSFTALLVSFAVLLTVPHLVAMLVAQIVFGLALGLIYSSSLFYSMDAGETKGEHGGIHEAAIGLGNMSGPLVGAVALQWWPARPDSGAVAVCALLAVGWLALLRAGWRRDCPLPGTEPPRSTSDQPSGPTA